jgi:two-component system, cell cycle response regulator DivK
MSSPSSVAARRKAAPRERRAASGQRRKYEGAELAPLILIVDDSDDTREIYSSFFQHSGLRVALAVDGDHGLWKVAMLKPAIIVMDLSMPVLNGWDATRELKADPRTKHIPVIALTGHVSDENLRRAKDVGADAVLTKPCTPDALLVVVRRLLDR